MLTLFIFFEVIMCILAMLWFRVSLSNCTKNGKFDFIEMFKSFLIFSGIAFFSIFIGSVMSKELRLRQLLQKLFLIKMIKKLKN